MNLQEMIVTDAEGKIETAEGKDLTGSCIQGEDIYSFYAIKQKNDPKSKPTPEKMAAKVKIMMPLGGELNGLYRFPRVGEKVVVAVEGTSHYLMGYLPSEETPFADKVDGKESTEPFDKQGQVLRYKKTGDNSTDKTYSEIGFYSDQTQWKNDADDINAANPNVDIINIASTGDISSSAQNFNHVSGQRVLVESKFLTQTNLDKAKDLKEMLLDAKEICKGDVHIKADHRIILNAREGLLLQVGPASISIKPTGIELSSMKLDGEDAGEGPFDASFSLSHNGGVKLYGKKFNGEFDNSCSLSDAFGGEISMTMGRASISGSSVTLSASTTLSAIFSMLDGVSNLLGQIMSVPLSSKYTWGKVSSYDVTKQISKIISIMDKVGDEFSESAGAGPKSSKDYVAKILDMVTAVVDAVRSVLEKDIYKQYNTHYDPDKKLYCSTDNRFACTLAFTIADAALQTTMLTNMIIRSSMALLHEASVSLSPTANVVIDSKGYYQDSVDAQIAMAAAAGVQVLESNQTLNKNQADTAVNEAENAENNAKAAQENAKQQKEQAEDNVKAAKEAVKNAQTSEDLENAKTQLKQAEDDLDTKTKQYDVAKNDYDQAKKNTKTAKENREKSSVAQAEAALERAQEHQNTVNQNGTDAEKAAAAEEVQKAQADLDKAKEKNLKDMKNKAMPGVKDVILKYGEKYVPTALKLGMFEMRNFATFINDSLSDATKKALEEL